MRTRFAVLSLVVLASVLVAAVPGAPQSAAAPAPEIPERVLAAVADLAPPPHSNGWRAGDALSLAGTIGIYESAAGTTHGQPLTFEIRVDDDPARTAGPFVAGQDGTFTADIPGSLTVGLAPGTHGLYVQAYDVTAERSALAATFTVADASADGTVVLRHQFVSSTGWVKPGGAFPLTTRVENHGATDVTDLTVTVPAPTSVQFVGAEPLENSGTAQASADTITWTIPAVPAATAEGPGTVTLVTTAQAVTLEVDPRLVWKDLSSTATLSGAGLTLTQVSHGPKVIPATGGFETARYGDKPFPMVPVAYADRQPQPDNDPADLDRIVNSPDFEGSTFNLYQEMSYGQLFPQGVVPSAGIEASTYSEVEEPMNFTTPEVTGTCRGATFAAVPGVIGSPVYDTRISGGWYQLPGTTEYYGGDYPVFDLGAAGAIDSACGQLGKAVYDAAVVSDPEIDYNRFDSDRDGVVDFFMLIFVGCGGNGASQIPLPETPATNELCPYTDAPYDNIWPHSSSLEMQYRDAETGLRGFVSNDQLRSLTEVPQCFVDETYSAFEDCAAHGGAGRDDLPVPVRVGPYNVNPETVFESASVISHEYGHHLGLPDYYNSSSAYDAYHEYNLMAADYGQNMTVFSKQELGWVVPRFIQPGQQVDVEGWSEIKQDTGEIHWFTPDGEPYVLSADNGDQNVRNGLAWAAKLPPRQVIDPELVAEQASGSTVLWSRRGNDFGCSPTGGHNIDLFLPELRDVPEGSQVTLNFKSAWDIEWDWDYGFVLTTTDGVEYASQPSDQGYTTSNSYDPNGQQCFAETDNGLTGQSGAYAQGEPAPTLARNPAANDYSAPLTFVEDNYDISELAGTAGIVRLSYFTDAAFDRPGWFVDDVSVSVDGEEIFATDFEDGLPEGRFFNGGCGTDGFNTAVMCTDGWMLLDTSAGDTSDHAYYLELRDRSSFDFEGFDQSDRGAMEWEPGLFVEYTDENHGYGNNGVPDHPAQHYLDSQPEAGAECYDERCDDASFTSAEGDTTFSDDPADPHLDNFHDPAHDEPGDDPLGLTGTAGRWTFDYGCLTAEVQDMAGHDTVQLETDLVADVALIAGEGCVAYEPWLAAEQPADVEASAAIAVKSTRVSAGEQVTFDGSGSSGDLPLEYTWDLGDGTTADGETVNHAYEQPGKYDVVLTVTDADGDTAEATVRMVVTGPPPKSSSPDSAPSADGGNAPSGAVDPASAPLPTTGGGLGLVGLVLLGASRALRRRS